MDFPAVHVKCLTVSVVLPLAVKAGVVMAPLFFFVAMRIHLLHIATFTKSPHPSLLSRTFFFKKGNWLWKAFLKTYANSFHDKQAETVK